MNARRGLRMLAAVKRAASAPVVFIIIVLLLVMVQTGCAALDARSLIDRSSLLSEISAVRGLQEKRKLLELLDDVCDSPASEVRAVFGSQWVAKYESLCPPPATGGIQ